MSYSLCQRCLLLIFTILRNISKQKSQATLLCFNIYIYTFLILVFILFNQSLLMAKKKKKMSHVMPCSTLSHYKITMINKKYRLKNSEFRLLSQMFFNIKQLSCYFYDIFNKTAVPSALIRVTSFMILLKFQLAIYRVFTR